VSPAGDYLIVGSGDGAGTLTVLDLVTGLVASYRGQEFRISAIAPPTPEYPMLISGDIRGGLRTWQMPPRIAGVVTTTDSKFYDAFVDKRGTTIIATTAQPQLTMISPQGGIRAIRPHDEYNIRVKPSSSGQTFATYGHYDAIELWSSATMTRTREIKTAHGSVTRLELIGDRGDVISSGRDGRLVRWSASGTDSLLARVEQPIDSFIWLSAADAIVFNTADGALWRRDGDGRVVSVRPAGARVRSLIATSDLRPFSGADLRSPADRARYRWHDQDLFHCATALALHPGRDRRFFSGGRVRR
jgi:WD40 repeat protein